MAAPVKPALILGGLPGWLGERYADAYAPAEIPGDAEARGGQIPAAAVAARAMARGAKLTVDAALLSALPRLELVCNFGVGYDGVDIAACRARGVAVTNAPGITDRCVADYAFALLLAVGRRIVDADRFVREGKWLHGTAPLTRRISGRRMGILGLGRIGLQIAKRAQAFDMPVAYHNRKPVPGSPYRWLASPVELAAESDVLAVACPGGAATRHLVDARVLDALGPRGVVINIARGSTIDEAALAAALRDKRIAGAGLDVFEEEPGLQAAFRELDNAVLSPHRAGGTEETWEDCIALVRGNLADFFAGRPVKHRVDLG